MLTLPPEPPNSQSIFGFQDRPPNNLPSDQPEALAILIPRDREERLVGDRLDEAVSQGIQRGAERPHVLGLGDPLLDCRVDRAIVDERSAGGGFKPGFPMESQHSVPGAKLGDLADAAGQRILMALDTALRVVDRTEPPVDFFALLKGRLRGLELFFGQEPVGRAVEPDWGFCWFHAGRQKILQGSAWWLGWL